jgi:hypothetical protein
LAALRLAPLLYGRQDCLGHRAILGGESAKGIALVFLYRQVSDEITFFGVAKRFFQPCYKVFHTRFH